MIVISEMQIFDSRSFAQIESELFSMPWSEKSLQDALENKDAIYLAAREGTELMGYIGFWRSFEEAEITNVAVKKEAQGKGIGTFLLKEAIFYAQQIGIKAFTLEVRTSNQVAIHLYKKIGFKEVGIRPRFYEKPVEDALVMWNYIEPSMEFERNYHCK